jgi:hypothetical protein
LETQVATEEDRELDDERRTWVFRDPELELHWVVIPGGQGSTVWERANRFGLVDAMVASTWCRLDGKLASFSG